MEEEQDTSWAKIIIVGVIAIIFLVTTIIGLLQNYYALKAISSIPKMIEETGLEDSVNPTEVQSSNSVITTRTCFENGVQINCSKIDKFLEAQK